MAYMWLMGLVTIFMVALVLWFKTYFKYQKHIGKYQGPPCIPLIGNMYDLDVGVAFMPYLAKCRIKYGKVVRFFFGYTPRLFISDVKFVEFLLSSNFILEKSYEYKFLHNWLGLGLLTSSGAKWKQSRKLLTPAFHFKILERFIEVFEKEGGTLLKILERFDGKEIDVFPYVNLYTLDVMCEASMNTTVNAQIDAKSDYVRSVKEICQIILYRSLSPLKMWDPLFSLSRDYQREKKALRVLHGFTNSVIKSRKVELQKNHSAQEAATEDDVGTKKRVAFLDLLLQAQINGESLPQELIREEVDTFMFEGHDTTTSGISFALYVLSKHQDVQEKVYEEVSSILSDDTKPMTYEDLQEMKYLELVIKETLRLYPPVVLFARTVTEDVEFDGGILPKGLDLSVDVYSLHHCPDLYPDPEVFDPERFSVENSRTRSHYAYIPFSAGPRNCIGQRFAMLELKSAVSKIINKFKLLPALGHEPELYVDVILKSNNGLPVRFQKRN